MLQLALKEQDFQTAAQIRDARRALDDTDPTAKLRTELQHALDTQDFSRACALRDRIDQLTMMLFAERAKPKFPIGLVVRHKLLGYRMILFGVDYRCRTARGGHSFFSSGLNERGDDQPWYHAAVDERDKTAGDNIVYVAEDECCPAAEGTLVQHPITRIMFKGIYETTTCPGLTCYIPCGRDEEAYEDYP
ncbi:Clp protease adapter protein ClpF, chloroplastic [Gracilariopsis chorda]|uniref:Clp protease adapter protein ClpF, chloroplastic n=1 Tax=Gracilariopsis chorda TaxID=448386 RepID=A0A2V3II54_9FLOR|nr:Clp protease adapter protein ClpF, chloroplastic [Gracilariopsis chorda]|eukprot:PXF41751.1 Clp protease adapter protein ClpF, chloroplastic [Gracilariopsis chorda]